MTGQETMLDKPLGGLFLMTLLTIIRTLLAEYYFDNFDYRIAGFVFAVVLIYFIYRYREFSQQKKAVLPHSEEAENPKQEKLYWIVVALEGVAIFAANVVLTNIGKAEYFISCFALIVGLHIIPLAKVFERKFDYYIGAWTALIAVAGITLVFQRILDYRLVNAFVCTGCAVSTTLDGLKMIADAKEILRNESNKDVAAQT